MLKGFLYLKLSFFLRVEAIRSDKRFFRLVKYDPTVVVGRNCVFHGRKEQHSTTKGSFA